MLWLCETILLACQTLLVVTMAMADGVEVALGGKLARQASDGAARIVYVWVRTEQIGHCRDEQPSDRRIDD